MDKNQYHDLLIRTLVKAGVPDSDANKAEIISSAGVDPSENSQVHAKTNTAIFDLLQKNELGKCIHITGGARALTDPYHRQICEAIRNERKDPFQVVFYSPKEIESGPWAIVKWNLSRWGAKGFSDWRQKLLTLNMIGRRSVNLKSYDERSHIQYSVFGNRYTQIQGDHNDDARAKHVWLIKSENVNGWLTELAEEELQKASDVDESTFKDFVSTLFSNTARIMLFKTLGEQILTQDDLLSDADVSQFDPDAHYKLDALSIMGFIAKNDFGHLCITSDGHSFLQEQK